MDIEIGIGTFFGYFACYGSCLFIYVFGLSGCFRLQVWCVWRGACMGG